MPFAAYNRIASDAFEGSIEITEQQYLEALEGLQNGWEVTIANGFSVAPPPPPVEPDLPDEPTKTPEALLADALAQRDYLLSIAAIRIAPLQDAVDLETASTQEVALLKKWKQYRVDINRVPQQSGFPDSINWPVQPSQ